MKKILKPIQLEQVTCLQQLSTQIFEEAFAAQNTPENMAAFLNEAYTVEKLSQELQNPDSEFFFLYVEETLAGYLKINVASAQTEEIAENALEVERIYIKKEFKRQGLGRFLIEAAIELAIEKGKENIWLGVWEKNHGARPFYESLGFEYVSAHTFVMGDDPQTDLIMLKKLKE